MDRMLFVAMAAAKQTMQAQSVAANNLANINTTGFRKDLEASMNVHVNGAGHPSRSYSVLAGQGFDASVSSLMQTGNPLDIAIQGEGWIAVQADDGTEAYTRAGNLQVNANGNLQTAAGQLVLGNGGPITLPPYNRVDVGADGTLSILPIGGNATNLAVVDRIRLVNPPAGDLYKAADGLMRIREGRPEAAADAGVQVVAGSLESSNVNGVDEMIRQIELARRFEAQIRMMSIAQELDQSSDDLLRNV